MSKLEMLKNTSQHHGALWPDYIASSVGDIDFAYLKKIGVKAIMIDLDGTVVERGRFDVSDKISNALKNQELKVYIATNRPKSRSLKDLKERLHASGVIHPKGIIGKPFTHYYKKSLEILSLNKNQVAMVGDRYLQDIYGANRAGLITIKVDKLGDPVNFGDSVISRLEHNRSTKILPFYKPI